MIVPCKNLTEKHYELLTLADDNLFAINDYVERGEIFHYTIEGKVVGIVVAIMTRPNTLELVNLAVDTAHQNQGIGKALIQHIKMIAKELKCHTITVGTGNSGIGQIKLYQQMGFRMKYIDTDYFKKHYDVRIFENGIECKDMIHFELEI